MSPSTWIAVVGAALVLLAGAGAALVVVRSRPVLHVVLGPTDRPDVIVAQALGSATSIRAGRWTSTFLDVGTPANPNWFGELHSPDRTGRVAVEVRAAADRTVQVWLRTEGATRAAQAAARAHARCAARLIREAAPPPVPTGRAPWAAALAGSGGRRRRVLIAAGAGVVVIALVGWFVLGRGSGGGVASPAPTSTTKGSASPRASTGSTTSTTSKGPAAIAKGKPKGAKACSAEFDLGERPRHAGVNTKTTCPFAEAVRRAYIESGARGAKVVLDDVYSPVTSKHYRMACTAAPKVRCTGGVNALVYLY